LLREFERELIHALARIAGFWAATATAERSRDSVTRNKFLVAGQNLPLTPTSPMAKLWLRDILPGDADFVPSIGIGDATLVYDVSNSSFDVLAIATQEALPINSTLVLSIRPTIDDQECHGTLLRFAYP